MQAGTLKQTQTDTDTLKYAIANICTAELGPYFSTNSLASSDVSWKEKDVPLKEGLSIQLAVRPPEDLSCIQPAASQCHELALHQPVHIPQGHPGNAVLVDHHTGTERLHCMGQVRGQQPPRGAESPALDFRIPIFQL